MLRLDPHIGVVGEPEIVVFAFSRSGRFVHPFSSSINTFIRQQSRTRVVHFCLQGFCLYGALQLDVKDTAEAFIPDGSYLLDTNDAVDK